MAVIVILGILILIAIPSVTKYIEKSKKKAFITSVNNIAGAVRYGVVSEDEKYTLGNATEKTFALKDIEVEKGKIDNINNIDGYIKVVKTTEGYEYKVYIDGSTAEKNNYCTREVDIKDLDSNLIKCPSPNPSPSSSYNTYAIGEEIEFAGSNWRVIKASTNQEDYVTVMKDTVLTHEQLGSYAYNGTYNTMEYTWTETCHNANHGYSLQDKSNCENTNGYEASKVKEMLETRYLPTLGAFNLKKVDGYKIRLITLEELQQNLSCLPSCRNSSYKSWVSQSVGYQGLYIHGYWTMTEYDGYSAGLWYVTTHYDISVTNVDAFDLGIRPVINLLKSSIK